MKPTSLLWRLRWLVIGVLAVVLVPLGVLSFNATLREIVELSDGRLAQSAHTLQLMVQSTGLDALNGEEHPSAITRHVPATVPLGKRTFESEVAFQVVGPAGQVRLATANFATLKPSAGDRGGFHDITLGGYRWRTYTLTDPVTGVTIRAGERYDSRHDILRALLFDHTIPILAGLPLIALLVGWAVRRGLKPLDQLANVLQARAPGSREPVQLATAPTELVPVIDALNQQITRLEDALERERRFSADVAHELRTPLTTSLISVEGAMGNDDPADAAAALDQAHGAIIQLARRVEQLLVLARLESGGAGGALEPLELGPIAMRVIDELSQSIAESGSDVSLQVPTIPVRVIGFQAGLAALMRNLLENALRHVPDGGQVILSVALLGDRAIVEVADNGPGIPAERRDDVFGRFHREASSRGDGYGLGLSIVKRVAELHNADIELLDSALGTGLCVRITLDAYFPASS